MGIKDFFGFVIKKDVKIPDVERKKLVDFLNQLYATKFKLNKNIKSLNETDKEKIVSMFQGLDKNTRKEVGDVTNAFVNPYYTGSVIKVIENKLREQ